MPIELRHRTFFAYLDVPKDVRTRLGRRVFRTTLQTDSRAVAERRAALLISQWKSEIAQAREEPDHDDARYWRDKLRRAKDAEERLIIETNLEGHVLSKGFDNTDPEAQRFYDEALGSVVRTTEHLEEWLSSLQVREKTSKMRRTTIERLAQKFPTLREISRKEVRRWATELLSELKPATVQRIMSDCRIYWTYLETIEIVPEESRPFDRLGLKVKRVSWLPYKPSEVTRLLDAAKADPQLADLIRLAMYTGARREELCRLKIENVLSDRFEVIDSKTEAGIRTIPIHPDLSELVSHLKEVSDDGYLLSGIKPNGNGDRGDALGKRFGRLKRAHDFDSRHSFHSLRGTIITMLERAGVPEGTVQDLVGHERSTLTGSTYSGKSSFEMRMNAICQLQYGDPSS